MRTADSVRTSSATGPPIVGEQIAQRTPQIECDQLFDDPFASRFLESVSHFVGQQLAEARAGSLQILSDCGGADRSTEALGQARRELLRGLFRMIGPGSQDRVERAAGSSFLDPSERTPRVL